MNIITPERVFLDTWVLKHLARGRPTIDVVHQVLRKVNQGEICIVVTYDHILDFLRDGDRTRANKEAAFVDTLSPLWMPPGNGIYQWEAYQEFLRITGQEIRVPMICPKSKLRDSILQLKECLKTNSVGSYQQSEGDPSFSSLLRGDFQYDDLLAAESPKQIHTAISDLFAFRDRERETQRSQKEWNTYVRKVVSRNYIAPFCQNPSSEYIEWVSEHLDFSKMPAWELFMLLEISNSRNSQLRNRPSDFVDVEHIALVPYIDVCVLEKHLAEVLKPIELEKIGITGVNIFRNIVKWLEAS